MASSLSIRKYPQREYELGKAPIQKKSMNHNCHLANLSFIKESLGDAVWNDLKESSIGVIIKLHEIEYVWSAKHVHYFLTNQLATKRTYEMWSLVGSKPIRFSLYEYGDITGLNIDPFEAKDTWDVDHKELWGEMGVSTIEGPNLKELLTVLGRCRPWDFEKRRMVGLLCLLSIGIYGISQTSRIPLPTAKRVMDREKFDTYPWGRVGFKQLIESIKCVTYEGKLTYIIRGFVHVLQIWACEAVVGIGEISGRKIQGTPQVPLLSWGGSRMRFKFDRFVLEEQEKHGEVRVRHMIIKPYEDIYPKWEGDEHDEDLDNMIKDILNDQLDTKAWDFPPIKKRKPGEDDDDKVTNVKDFVASEDQRVLDSNVAGLVNMVETLSERDGAIDATIAARCTSVEGGLNIRIRSLENDMKELKEKLIPTEKREVAVSNVNVDDDASSQTPAAKHAQRSKGGVKAVCKKDVGKPQDRKQGVNVEKGKYVVDLGEEASTESVRREQAFSNTLNSLLAGIKGLDDDDPTDKRQPLLAPPLRWPYVGSSDMKRIITTTRSTEIYDPISKVPESKRRAMMDFIEDD
ncbi:uncharacterized protein LOC112087823 [Eutrema salsugineum]|uniref:uncharacterized protein LOC112087823 n=1 Tax=Eutrema salsugineum TaxID=72664 RepID=UPI000CED3286|nr:uncharacterized protein LOC112087823 [Eutrema salsugineum]